MAYSRFRSAWKNRPDTSTPITAEALDHFEEGVKAAHDVLDGRLSDTALNATYAPVSGSAAYAPATPLAVATRSKTGNPRLSTSAAAALSDGTATAQMTRVRHRATAGAHSVRFVYTNIAGGSVGPNPITVKAAFEYSLGAIVPVFFNGSRTGVCAPGGILVSDPIPVELADNDLFYSRNLVTVGSAGEKWPLGPYISTSVGDGTAATDLVDSGAITGGNATYAFGPSAIVGSKVGAATAVLLLGDSILQGLGDGSSEPTTDAGWGARALNNEYGYVNVALAGEEASQFQPGNARRLSRLPLARYCTHAIVNHGINDVKADSTTAQIQQRLTNIWTALANMGLKVYQSTLTPVTTGTFTTEAGQTKQTQAREDVRIAVNTWIRSTPAPLTGFLEAADAVETARNSGIWKANYTTDGTHPSATGAAAIATAVAPLPF
ncbi:MULTISPECIES: SGNH/GDSL hydrolase family protein [unclassified Rhodococcus (in: high G+C Gram-positive bacteria)]|uniref:SGNH/GDSL hydrolase family protein n=2 Tax=Rhodococcus TaxID=1827 RepID=UPI0009FB14B5